MKVPEIRLPERVSAALDAIGLTYGVHEAESYSFFIVFKTHSMSNKFNPLVGTKVVVIGGTSGMGTSLPTSSHEQCTLKTTV